MWATPAQLRSDFLAPKASIPSAVTSLTGRFLKFCSGVRCLYEKESGIYGDCS